MKKILGFCILVVLLGAASPVLADSYPYPNVGQVAPTNTFVAISGGNVTGYFVSKGSAVLIDFVGVVDLTTHSFSGWQFDNQTTAPGAMANFGSVNAGDKLAIVLTEFPLELFDVAPLFSSIPAQSVDGINHVYATNWTGAFVNGTWVPGGLYIGTEDLPIWFSDLNYNDDSFVLTDVRTASSVPEPVSLLLFGAGILGLAALSRRKHAVSN